MRNSNQVRAILKTLATDRLLSDAGVYSPPIDLLALAKYCKIPSIEIRDMIPRGGVEPVRGGFRVYLRGADNGRLICMDSKSELQAIDRFALAHEIGQPPTGQVLEDGCDLAAANLVAPSGLLEDRLKKGARRSVDTILAIGEEFAISAVQVLGRVADIAPPWMDLAIILLEKTSGGVARVLAAWFGTELMALLPPLERDSIVTSNDSNWSHALSAVAGESWEISKNERILVFTKIADKGGPSRFLLEVRAKDRQQILPALPS